MFWLSTDFNPLSVELKIFSISFPFFGFLEIILSIIFINNNRIIPLKKNRIKLTSHHYFKTHQEMTDLFSDLPEALENNYNFPYRCNFRPLPSKPILPNISSEKGINANDLLKKEAEEGLVEKFLKVFKIKETQ